MVNLVRLIIIFVVVYYVLRFISRYIIPFAVNSYLKKNLGDLSQYEQYRKDKMTPRPEGEVTIKYQTDKDKKIIKDKGDYIDFEEVKP